MDPSAKLAQGGDHGRIVIEQVEQTHDLVEPRHHARPASMLVRPGEQTWLLTKVEAAALATYAPVLDTGPNGVQHVVLVKASTVIEHLGTSGRKEVGGVHGHEPSPTTDVVLT